MSLPFSQTRQLRSLFSPDKNISYKVGIHATVDGGFFLVDYTWTCHRRNYLQVSAGFSLEPEGTRIAPGVEEGFVPGYDTLLVQIECALRPVRGFLLGITARIDETNESVGLVQLTTKRSRGPQSVPCPLPVSPTAWSAPLPPSFAATSGGIVTFGRLQFKSATANNGRRRAIQQYYVLDVNLFAQVEDGEEPLLVGTCFSAPLVVRGRSPGHFTGGGTALTPEDIGTRSDADSAAASPQTPLSPDCMELPTAEVGSMTHHGPARAGNVPSTAILTHCHVLAGPSPSSPGPEPSPHIHMPPTFRHPNAGALSPPPCFHTQTIETIPPTAATIHNLHTFPNGTTEPHESRALGNVLMSPRKQVDLPQGHAPVPQGFVQLGGQSGQPFCVSPTWQGQLDQAPGAGALQPRGSPTSAGWVAGLPHNTTIYAQPPASSHIPFHQPVTTIRPESPGTFLERGSEKR